MLTTGQQEDKGNGEEAEWAGERDRCLERVLLGKGSSNRGARVLGMKAESS